MRGRVSSTVTTSDWAIVSSHSRCRPWRSWKRPPWRPPMCGIRSSDGPRQTRPPTRPRSSRWRPSWPWRSVPSARIADPRSRLGRGTWRVGGGGTRPATQGLVHGHEPLPRAEGPGQSHTPLEKGPERGPEELFRGLVKYCGVPVHAAWRCANGRPWRNHRTAMGWHLRHRASGARPRSR